MGNPALSGLLATYLHRLDVGATLKDVLTTLSNPETSTAQALIPILQRNQAYDHFLQGSELIKNRKSNLLKDDESAPKPSDRPAPTERSWAERNTALLGKIATRDAVVALRLFRQSGQGLPRSDKDKLSLNIAKNLRYATEAVSFCDDHLIPHADDIYNAGFLYDWINQFAERQKGTPKTALLYLKELWTESLRAGQLSHHMGSNLKYFKYQQYAFAGAMAVNLGRFLMAAFFPSAPSWNDFLAQCKKDGLVDGSQAFITRERKMFPVTHNEMSSLVCGFFHPLRAIEKAVYYYQEPYFLRTIHPDLFRLSVLFCVSRELASRAQDINRLNPFETLRPYQRPWLTEIGLTEKMVSKAVMALVNAGGQ